MQVSELMAGFLERLGVQVVFGMPGAHILPVYDALYDSPVRTVLAKHEQGAAFMACGYARASGRVGVCIATAGPGATNLVTGIANAYADALPVLAITGETATYIFGRGGLQESSGEGGSIDQVALFAPITRYRRLVERTDYLDSVLGQTAQALLAEPPGPVLLCLPFNVQKERADATLLERLRLPLTGDGPSRVGDRKLAEDLSPTPVTTEAAELAGLLRAARHPVILAGHGCLRAGAQAELTTLASALGIPVASTLKAKGVVDETSPLSLGSLGVTSSGRAFRHIVERADLLLILGASFGERTSYVWDQGLLEGRRIVQVDLDPRQLERNFRADLAIRGDIREVLRGVLQSLGLSPAGTAAAVPPSGARPAEAPPPEDYALFQAGFGVVRRFYETLARRLPGRAVLFDDNIIFAQNFYPVRGGSRYYPNTGISALGQAIPAAIGARFALPSDSAVFAILGDGGFQMCGMELMTAVNYRLPLNVVLLSNGTMGLVRKNQHQHYRQRFISCDFENPDYELLARAFGIAYRQVRTEAEVDAVFDGMDLTGGINLIEIVLPRDLYPNYSSRR